MPLRLGFKTKIEESKKQAAFVHAYEAYVEAYDNQKVQSTFKKLSVHAFTRATVLYPLFALASSVVVLCLHWLLRRLCSQMPNPPHCLQRRLLRLCSQMMLDPTYCLQSVMRVSGHVPRETSMLTDSSTGIIFREYQGELPQG